MIVLPRVLKINFKRYHRIHVESEYASKEAHRSDTRLLKFDILRAHDLICNQNVQLKVDNVDKIRETHQSAYSQCPEPGDRHICYQRVRILYLRRNIP